MDQLNEKFKLINDLLGGDNQLYDFYAHSDILVDQEKQTAEKRRKYYEEMKRR